MKIAEGHQRIMPYLIVKDAGKFIAFMKTVFGAEVQLHVPRFENVIAHAELRIGEQTIMLADATDEFPVSPGGLFIYVPDTDATFQLALDHGAVSLMEPQQQDYGDRAAGVRDPFGNTWWLATLH